MIYMADDLTLKIIWSMLLFFGMTCPQLQVNKQFRVYTPFDVSKSGFVLPLADSPATVLYLKDEQRYDEYEGRGGDQKGGIPRKGRRRSTQRYSA